MNINNFSYVQYPGSDLPIGTSGCYAFFDSAFKCLYVGRTINHRKRTYQHKQNSYWFKNAYVAVYWECKEKENHILEATLLKSLNPEHNVIRLSRGIKQDFDFKAIKKERLYHYLDMIWIKDTKKIY